MELVELANEYIDSLEELFSAKEERKNELQARCNSLFDSIKNALGSFSKNDIQLFVRVLKEIIDQKKLELEVVMQRYPLGLNQVNIAIQKDDQYSEKRFNKLIDTTMSQARALEYVLNGYKEILNEAEFALGITRY